MPARPSDAPLDAQELAGLPPGRWLGRGLRALGLTEGAEVSGRQLELLFGEGRHSDATRTCPGSRPLSGPAPQ
ncbi:relaxase domain-containing protein [Streptomyces longwoodensis]|uniref:relaxase domain-containing protein n=1 Tax=Streptomyces longwoodensis TaxID=68231 RepID=UPI003F4CE059